MPAIASTTRLSFSPYRQGFFKAQHATSGFILEFLGICALLEGDETRRHIRDHFTAEDIQTCLRIEEFAGAIILSHGGFEPVFVKDLLCQSALHAARFCHGFIDPMNLILSLRELR